MIAHIRMSAHSPKLLLVLVAALVPMAVPAEDTSKPNRRKRQFTRSVMPDAQGRSIEEMSPFRSLISGQNV